MTPTRPYILRNYFLGLASIVAGAGLTSAMDSMLPLAMGGAVGVMCTVSLVRSLCGAEVRRG